MGDYKNSEYYDYIYTGGKYKLNWMDSVYLKLWTEVLTCLNKEDNILEVGCGTGQFADMLREKGFNNYKGFDFSKGAILECEKKNLNCVVEDALKKETYNSEYHTVIALEVFEHTDDIKIIENVRKATQSVKLVITVPDFDDNSHVRFFNSMSQVITRYEPHMRIEEMRKVEKWFLIKGYIE